MRLPDRVTGLFLVGLGAAAAYGGWQLPPVPGQPVGPNVFPLVIGTGLALCGLAIAFGIGHSFEEEEELIPVEGGQPTPPPTGKLYGLRALPPPPSPPSWRRPRWRSSPAIFPARCCAFPAPPPRPLTPTKPTP